MKKKLLRPSNNVKKWKKVVLLILAAIGVVLLLVIFLVFLSTKSLIIVEPTGDHTSTFIFLHGLGDSAENWQKTFEPLYKINPHIKFIFPSASWKFISMSYGIPMKAWYNIRGNINDKMNLECDEKGLLESVQWIENIIQSEINSGIASEKIIVGGFSQGGSLALTLGLITKQKLNKILCLSGFLPCREKIFSWAEKGNESTFVFYHNEGDEVVPFLIGLKSYELLRNYCGLEKVSFDERSRDRGHFWSQRNIEEVLGKELEVL